MCTHAVWCSVVQYGAVWCSVVQCDAVRCRMCDDSIYSVLQRVTGATVCCSVWQRAALHEISRDDIGDDSIYSVLQCVARCCSVLQCVALHKMSRDDVGDDSTCWHQVMVVEVGVGVGLESVLEVLVEGGATRKLEAVARQLLQGQPQMGG